MSTRPRRVVVAFRLDPHMDWEGVRRAVEFFGREGAEQIYSVHEVAFALATCQGAPDPRPKWSADNS